MHRQRFILASALFALASSSIAGAQTAPTTAYTPAPPPTTAEATFLATIMRDLPARYPTPQAANKAGYVRFSNEDETGAISYANTKAWNSTDPDVPAQLWYDVNDRLIGADYSVRQADAPAGPALFGIDPKRFGKVGAHIHYVTCMVMHGETTTMSPGCIYGKAVGAKKYATVGDVEHPTAQGLVQLGVVKDAAAVKTVFLYPAIYDVSIWVVRNPLGQFAEHNPNVIPSPNAGKGDDM
jgi:hypothetical protein